MTDKGLAGSIQVECRPISRKQSSHNELWAFIDPFFMGLGPMTAVSEASRRGHCVIYTHAVDQAGTCLHNNGYCYGLPNYGSKMLTIREETNR